MRPRTEEGLVTPPGTDELVERLVGLARRGAPVTLIVGPQLTASAVPDIEELLRLAEQYAESRPENPALRAALQRARTEHTDDLSVYRAYRAALANYIAANEFDVVAQEAVLRAYQPADRRFSGRGQWQRVEAPLGMRFERDTGSWQLPPAVAALGAILARQPHLFAYRVLTTTFDPLLEIAISRAGGVAAPRPLILDPPAPADRPPSTVVVHHLHGYWRADAEHNRQHLLHNPSYLIEHRQRLAERVAELIETETVCVIGHVDWDGVLSAALRIIALKGLRRTVLRAPLAGGDPVVLEGLEPPVEPWGGAPPRITTFEGVDHTALLTRLADELDVNVPPREPVLRRFRHPHWERELISEAGTVPPDEPLDLLRQLDRRFQWERAWATAEPVAPALVFWPVRLRQSPSVINMVQALAAASLSARNAHVVVCLDDFNVDEPVRSAERFTRDVRRWFDLVPDRQPPEIRSLQEFIDEVDLVEERPLLRPTRPWDVVREAVGDRNPSVLNLLMAAKIIPDQPMEELLANAEKIVRALDSRNARHLMTPFMLWAYLNHLLTERRSAIASVMTLGGREESRLWEMWRLAFDHGVHQLYNPTIRNLTNQSLMLRWTHTGELHTYLSDALRDDDWGENGHYVKWLVQNAFLLPIYLTDGEYPMSGGIRLDSWPAVQEALREDRNVIELIAEKVSRAYLGDVSG
jgi:hypothetical protein